MTAIPEPESTPTADSSPHDVWVSRALHAFPRRWREAHGDEFIDVSRATTERRSGGPSGAAPRPAVRELADTVRSGLQVRYRSRPPLSDVMKYRSFAMPVPREHFGWMRDDLRSRTLNLRHTLPVLLANSLVYLFIAWSSISRLGFDLLFLLPLVVAMLWALHYARRHPEKAKGEVFRRKVIAAVGYDIISIPEPPPVGWLPSERRLAELQQMNRGPAVRTRVSSWVPQLGFLALISGAALLAGAARPNTETSLGPLSYVPDPNSPLPAQYVGLLTIVAVVAAIALGALMLAGYSWLVRQTPSETIHPLSVHGGLTALWKIALVPAVLGSVLGVSGAAPDLACASIGAVLLASGVLGLTLAAMAHRFEQTYGRPLTLGDVLVGERPVGVGMMRAVQRSQHSG